MGCVASRLGEEEEVVLICRERKKLMKMAVHRRSSLSESHTRYMEALFAVSAALKLFVARHSTPASQYLITFPPPNCTTTTTPPPQPAATEPTNVVANNPLFLRQTPSGSAHKTVSYRSYEYNSSVEYEENDVCVTSSVIHDDPNGEYYYGVGGLDMTPPMPSPQTDYSGWDFFNPFAGVRPEVAVHGFYRSSEEYMRVVREREGIPELEEEEGKVVVSNGEERNVVNAVRSSCEVVRGNESGVDVVGNGEKGLSVVVDGGGKGRELLDALKDIEDHFIRAVDSCKDLTRMLEAKRCNVQAGLEEIKENSTKLMQSITWHRSASRSSSCKSLAASSSRSSSTWSENRNDTFDDYGGMAAGSHSLTLERLYAWEKKLYEEVKAGDDVRKLYERKCSLLRDKDVKGDDTPSMDKARAEVKDLYSRILVAIRRAESVSGKIQKLTAEELQPQIMELLQGLTQTWNIMLQCHETQNQIMYEVKTYDCSTYGKFYGDERRRATLQLVAEIQNWRECFNEYIAAQKFYVAAIHGWLSKFIVPEGDFCSRVRRSAPPYRANGPPLYAVCNDWLAWMDNLPDKSVSLAMRLFVKDVKAVWNQEAEEQDEMRRVDRLGKELDKKKAAYEKVESRVLETKFLEYKPDPDTHILEETEDGVDYLTEKQEMLENFRVKLEEEKEKYHNCVQETQRITLNGFQTGFGLVFDSLVQFSKASVKMYNDLATSKQNLDKAENPSHCIEASSAAEGITR
ncbi:hypothetical protein Droror1_Dr00001284 [Drosera rotundifolia]